ncbi:imidazolonepropionase-like domain-containing protein [Streptodolium elevatio]|uniref:imidazolonepropionase-like domain-containing protein n=1 Tax=Streptodolium elevatio TaxID=3157996 RepID=UPI003F4CE1F8
MAVAVAVRGGRILAVGEAEDIAPLRARVPAPSTSKAGVCCRGSWNRTATPPRTPRCSAEA